MPQVCYVDSCKNGARHTHRQIVMPHVLDLHFHRARKSEYGEWEAILHKPNHSVGPFTVICSNHFKYGKPLHSSRSPCMYLDKYPDWAMTRLEAVRRAQGLEDDVICEILAHMVQYLWPDVAVTVAEQCLSVTLQSSNAVERLCKIILEAEPENVRRIFPCIAPHVYPGKVVEAFAIYQYGIKIEGVQTVLSLEKQNKSLAACHNYATGQVISQKRDGTNTQKMKIISKIMDTSFPRKVVEMWQKGCGCDTTIVCEDGHSLKAHSLVLCSVSDKMSDLLTSKEIKVVETPHVKADVWSVLLETVYTGTFDLDVSTDELNDIFYLARCFDMTSVLDALEKVKKDKELKEDNDNDGEATESSETLSNDGSDESSSQELDGGGNVKTKNIGSCSLTKLKEKIPDKKAATNTVSAELKAGIASDSDQMQEVNDSPKDGIKKRKRTCKNTGAESMSKKVKNKLGNVESGVNSKTSHERACSSSEDDYGSGIKTNAHPLGKHGAKSASAKVKKHIESIETPRRSRRKGVTCKTCSEMFDSYNALMKHTCGHESQAKVKNLQGDLDDLVFVDIVMSSSNNDATEMKDSEEGKETEYDDLEIDKPSPIKSGKTDKQLSGIEWLKRKGLLNDFEKKPGKQWKRHKIKTEDVATLLVQRNDESSNDEQEQSSLAEKNRVEVKLTPLNIKSELRKKTCAAPRRCVCFKCGDNCTSETVRCALCFSIVTRTVDHMDECHPFTPATNAWVFRCNFNEHEELKGEMDQKQILISTKLCKSKKQKHWVKGESRSYYKCLKCKHFCECLDDLKKHFVERHQIVLKTCTVCESGFQYSYYLRDHQHFCEGGELYKCNFCGETLGGFNAWTSHVEKHAEKCSKDTPLINVEATGWGEDGSTQISIIQLKNEQQCTDVADNNTGKEEALDIQVTPVGSSTHFCLGCKENCSAEKVLCLYCFQIVDRSLDHMPSQHPFTPVKSLWVFSCNQELFEKYQSKGTVVCSKVQFHAPKSDEFNSTSHTKADSDTATDEVIKLFAFACQTCKTTFSAFEELLNHISHKFVCHICNVIFESLKSVSDHVKVAHTDLEFHACQTCDMAFVDISALASHEYYCSGGTILQCEPCDLVFTNQTEMDIHMTEVLHETESIAEEISTTLDMNLMVAELGNSMVGELGKAEVTELGGDVYSGKKELVKVTEILTDIPHKKVCLLCGPECEGDIVQCVYCAERIPVVCKKSHFDEMHPGIPQTSVWPVYCKKARMRRGTNDGMIAKQIPISDTEEATTDEQQQTLNCTYKCCKCSTQLQTPLAMVAHVKQEHRAKAVPCDTCGMILHAHQDMLVSEHQYFCRGGALYQCHFCGRLCGSEKTAALHRFGIHKTYNKAEPWSKLKGQVPINLIEGKNGYKILCVGCRGNCDSGQQVMCGLCREVVEKDDVHMKIKHAHSPTTTWVICCDFKVMSASDKKMAKIHIGERVPDLLAPYKYKCLECTICFEEETSLKEHIADEHADCVFKMTDPMNKLYSLSCQHCGMVLMCKRNDYLVDHVQFCSTGTLHLCNMCGKEFGSYEKLTKHQTDMDCGLNQLKRRKAAEDGSTFVSIPPGFKLQCAECSFNTTIIRELKDHNKFVHGYTKYEINQICQYCFKVFRKKSRRERHEEDEHLEKDILCDECGQSFHTKTQYTCHRRYYHQGKRAIICEQQKLKRALEGSKECRVCGKQFKSQYLLNQHIKIHHEKSLAITCHICGKSFLAKHRLTTHLNRHAGVKPYKCTECPYTDYTGALVNKHMRKQHPGIEIAYKKTSILQGEESEEVPDGANNNASVYVNEEQFYQEEICTAFSQDIVGVQQNIIIDETQVSMSNNGAGIIEVAENDPNIIIDENSGDPHVVLDENMYKYIIFK